MVLYLLLAIFLWVRGRERLALVPFALSVFVKLFTLPLLAVHLWRRVRVRGWRVLAADSSVVLAVALAIYAPFWRSADLVLRHAGSVDRAATATSNVLKPILMLGFAALTVWVGWTQVGSRARLLRGWAVLLLFFGLFLTQLGFAWYLMTLVAVLSLVPVWPLRVLAVALSFGSLLLNVWYSTFSGGFKVPELLSLPRLAVYLVLPALVAASTFVALAMQRRRRAA
jgi:hypothetical protein